MVQQKKKQNSLEASRYLKSVQIDRRQERRPVSVGQIVMSIEGYQIKGQPATAAVVPHPFPFGELQAALISAPHGAEQRESNVQGMASYC